MKRRELPGGLALRAFDLYTHTARQIYATIKREGNKKISPRAVPRPIGLLFFSLALRMPRIIIV
jgi:hypothetical protein